MSCPAVEHGKAVKASNDQRMREITEEFMDAGLLPQLNELLDIEAWTKLRSVGL